MFPPTIDTSPSKGPLPGLRNMPIIINEKSGGANLHQDHEIRDKWLEQFFDDLGSVS